MGTHYRGCNLSQEVSVFRIFKKISKQAILFLKFLHENSTSRKNEIYHDVANEKCKKTVNSDCWYSYFRHRDFSIQSLPFLRFFNFWNLKKLWILNEKISVTKFWKSKFWIDSFLAFFMGFVMAYFILFISDIFLEKFAK